MKESCHVTFYNDAIQNTSNERLNPKWQKSEKKSNYDKQAHSHDNEMQGGK